MKSIQLTLGAAALAAMCAAVPAMAQSGTSPGNAGPGQSVTSPTGENVESGTGMPLAPSTTMSSASMGNGTYSSMTTTTTVLGAGPATVVRTGSYVTPLPPADGYRRADYERWLRLR